MDTTKVQHVMTISNSNQFTCFHQKHIKENVHEKEYTRTHDIFILDNIICRILQTPCIAFQHSFQHITNCI